MMKELKALKTKDGSGRLPVCIGNQWYIPWIFPTCTPDPSGTLCTPCNNPVGDNNEENDIPTNIIEYETMHIDSNVDGNLDWIFP